VKPTSDCRSNSGLCNHLSDPPLPAPHVRWLDGSSHSAAQTKCGCPFLKSPNQIFVVFASTIDSPIPNHNRIITTSDTAKVGSVFKNTFAATLRATTWHGDTDNKLRITTRDKMPSEAGHRRELRPPRWTPPRQFRDRDRDWSLVACCNSSCRVILSRPVANLYDSIRQVSYPQPKAMMAEADR